MLLHPCFVISFSILLEIQFKEFLKFDLGFIESV